MKRSALVSNKILIATLMAMSPSLVLAQTQPTTGMGFLPAAVPVVVQPGTYTNQNLNQTEVTAQILSKLKDRQQQDFDYVKTSVDDLADAFRDLQASEFSALQKLSASSMQSLISYTDYLSATRAYINKRNEIETMIVKITQIPDALKAAGKSATAGDWKVELPGQLTLDFTSTVAGFHQQFGSLDAQVQGLKFNTNLPSNVMVTFVGINGATSDGRTIRDSDLISQDLINKQTQSIQDMQVNLRSNAKYLNRLSQLNKFDINLVNAYINNQGKAQQWNKSSPDEAVNATEIRDITEAFWMRSYLRARYGVPLGAIAVRFKSMPFALQELVAPNNLEYVSDLRGQADIHTAAMMLDKAVRTFKGGAELDSRSNPLQLLRFTLNRLSGKWNEAEANFFVVKLLALDIKEEETIIQGGGLRQMRDLYTARYKSTPDMKKFYNALGHSYEGDDGDAFGDVGMASADSSRGLFALLKPTFLNILSDQERIDRATQSLALMEADFATINKSNQRANTLNDD